MAAAVQDSRVSAGKKLKNSLKKKKRMKMVAKAVASELEDEDKGAADSGGNVPGLSFGCSKERPGRVCGKQGMRVGWLSAARVVSPRAVEGVALVPWEGLRKRCSGKGCCQLFKLAPSFTRRFQHHCYELKRMKLLLLAATRSSLQ